MRIRISDDDAVKVEKFVRAAVLQGVEFGYKQCEKGNNLEMAKLQALRDLQLSVNDVCDRT